jgi:hypothetical protein
MERAFPCILMASIDSVALACMFSGIGCLRHVPPTIMNDADDSMEGTFVGFSTISPKPIAIITRTFEHHLLLEFDFISKHTPAYVNSH